MNPSPYHQQFLESKRKHILMLSTHGVHEWKVVPGLMDTGGQNVFVNQFSAALAKKEYRLTIVNRGGYKHPRTEQTQSGLIYKDKNQRILYLEDGREEFVRKEDMGDQFPDLVKAASDFLLAEGFHIDLIISHYWDAGILGCLLKRDLGINAKHIWVPHSLGMVKKRNLPSQDWDSLRIPERIEYENKILNQVDFVAATSSIIRDSANMEYDFGGKFLWIPPCVDQARFYPRQVSKTDSVWSFLSKLTDLPEVAIQNRKIITEISRTDKTKQKDILIKSFAQVLKKHPESLLIITIDDANEVLSQELRTLISAFNVEQSTAVVGSIWEALPKIYAITDIYCTPSIMEGFGMSVQEAAASKVPVISSDLVPFVTEYLAGDQGRRIKSESGSEILVGEGALIVSPGDIDGFSFALDILLSDDTLRKKMGDNAYQTVIQNFTWDHIVQEFINDLSIL